MSRVFVDKNPQNIHNSDLLTVLSMSPHMAQALTDCPENEMQAMFNSFNTLMWQMHEVAISAVHEATQRRSLRAIQVGHKEFEPEKLVEIKEGTQPNIYFDEKDSIYKADVETPTGMVTVKFKEKK